MLNNKDVTDLINNLSDTSKDEDSPIIIKNEKFSTAALVFSLRMPLTGHNLAYASLLARMQMNASASYPTLSEQSK